jgi:hypothetical protein
MKSFFVKIFIVFLILDNVHSITAAAGDDRWKSDAGFEAWKRTASGAASGGGAITALSTSGLGRTSSLFDTFNPESTTAAPLASTTAGSMAFWEDMQDDEQEIRDLPTPMSFKEEKTILPAGSKRTRSDDMNYEDLPSDGDMDDEDLPASSAAAATGGALVRTASEGDKDVVQPVKRARPEYLSLASLSSSSSSALPMPERLVFGISESDKDASSSESDTDEEGDDQEYDRGMEYEEFEEDEESEVALVGVSDLYPASSSSSSSSSSSAAAAPKRMPADLTGADLTRKKYEEYLRTTHNTSPLTFEQWRAKLLKSRQRNASLNQRKTTPQSSRSSSHVPDLLPRKKRAFKPEEAPTIHALIALLDAEPSWSDAQIRGLLRKAKIPNTDVHKAIILKYIDRHIRQHKHLSEFETLTPDDISDYKEFIRRSRANSLLPITGWKKSNIRNARHSAARRAQRDKKEDDKE